VAALSVGGWQQNEDAVVMRSHRLVLSVPPDTVEQYRIMGMAQLRAQGEL